MYNQAVVCGDAPKPGLAHLLYMGSEDCYLYTWVHVTYSVEERHADGCMDELKVPERNFVQAFPLHRDFERRHINEDLIINDRDLLNKHYALELQMCNIERCCDVEVSVKIKEARIFGDTGVAVSKKSVCYHCSQMGHQKARCPRIICFRCNNQGHLSSICNDKMK